MLPEHPEPVDSYPENIQEISVDKPAEPVTHLVCVRPATELSALPQPETGA